MDQDQFRPTARELLERDIAETDPPKQATPEVAFEPEPSRPVDQPGTHYASGLGDYVSQTRAALHNDAMINREYHDHERDAQQDLEQHIDKAAPEQTVSAPVQEAQQEPEQKNEIDWQRYTQDKEYRGQVNEQQEQRQQEQQLQVTAQHHRER